MKRQIYYALTAAGAVAAMYFSPALFSEKKGESERILAGCCGLRSYDVAVHTVGELEALMSTSITSAIKGDLGKIIYLVADGESVQADELLVKMDPTPFEEHIEDLKRQIREQQSKTALLERMVAWEKHQVEHEDKAARIEVEGAKLEVKKAVYGDGPIEEARLKSAVQKAFSKYSELRSFADDLINLQAHHFLNPVELKQAEDKLAEEEENYLAAQMLYENFIKHSQPMQIKKTEIALRRCENKFEETIKSGAFKIAKAHAQLEQATQELNDLSLQLKRAELQMTLTEIKAPNAGMVVLREEYRNGQRRKPRLGDIVIRNQAILDLPDLEAMLVKTKVREIDLFKIHVGTRGTVEVDAYPELRFEGAISSIGVLAVSDAARTGEEKYFDVTVKLDSSDPRLRPGMTARVLLHSSRIDNKWSIPIQAVFEFDKKYYCFVPQGSGYVAVPIELGGSNELWVEVTSGLDADVPVLLSMPAWSEVVNGEDIKKGKQ